MTQLNKLRPQAPPDVDTLDAKYHERIIIGPPGCGKTTELGRQVRLATEAGLNVLVSSLTRASAAEIAGRDLPIPADAVGTLHSHCFNALGQPAIAEDRTHLEDWNANHPALALTTSAADKSKSFDEDNLDPSVNDSPGDEFMAKYQLLRSRMQTPPPDSDIGRFASQWSDWKNANDLVDFTDLIELSLQDITHAPGAPDVLYVDEAQDLDLLEMTLLRKWADSAGQLVAVGDPDQAIYTWRGADPTAFSAPGSASTGAHVLEQSYRAPRSVHAHAAAWIDRTPSPVFHVNPNCRPGPSPQMPFKASLAQFQGLCGLLCPITRRQSPFNPLKSRSDEKGPPTPWAEAQPPALTCATRQETTVSTTLRCPVLLANHAPDTGYPQPENTVNNQEL